jgi:glycosyltransferase involved in cell wall biosynthesis
MKILLPYFTHPQNLLADIATNAESKSKKVVEGGMEKFYYNLEEHVDGIIPVMITREDKDNRLTKRRIQDAIAQHDPDIIIFNNPWWGKMMISLGLPLIAIVHEPLVRDIRMIELGTILKTLNDSGAHIYFVSQFQLDFHRNMAKRIKDVDFGNIKGFINPSYLRSDTPYSSDNRYDVSTVGRFDDDKDPFLIHRKLQNTDLNSLVVSNNTLYKNDARNKYVEDNQNWTAPQCTMLGYAHSDVLEAVSKSSAFVSTWPKESWGITAMEALGCGVPVILLVDDTDTHASESIAADSSHYIKIRKKCSKEEFESAARKAIAIPESKRRDIASMTKRKHSLTNWKLSIDKMISLRYNDATGKPKTLMEFFV